MADLTPLDEKLAEVLGLAQAARSAAETVGSMEDAAGFADDLQRMRQQAAETERRTEELIDGLAGKKTAIREMARETKHEATGMMKTYLAGEEEAPRRLRVPEHVLDGPCAWRGLLLLERLAGVAAQQRAGLGAAMSATAALKPSAGARTSARSSVLPQPVSASSTAPAAAMWPIAVIGPLLPGRPGAYPRRRPHGPTRRETSRLSRGRVREELSRLGERVAAEHERAPRGIPRPRHNRCRACSIRPRAL